MRLSSQNNQFIFNYPNDFIPKEIEERMLLFMEKNFIPYDSVLDFINSTIKEITFPSIQFNTSTQTLKRGKEVHFKNAGSVYDNFTRELDITFRSVDSHINYFMLFEILNEYYLNNKTPYIPIFNLDILDKNGDIVYTIVFREVLLKSESELRLSYHVTDISEKTFSITFLFNFIDIYWKISDEPNTPEKNIFDIPISEPKHRI
jgi:hypothetical protein